MSDNFPNDATGLTLNRLLAGGDALDSAREINFSVIFNNEASALAFCEAMSGAGMNLKHKYVPDERGYNWDVTVTRRMIPTHADIAKFEDELERQAAPWGGENDGWGCFSQNASQSPEAS